MRDSIDIGTLISECMKTYGNYVLKERQIPDFRDGLKPVQRRILYTLYEDGNTWKGKYIKCAATAGDATARYHPHGTDPLYGALVNMTGLPLPKNKKIFYGPNAPYPLIEGYGNFGSIDGDNAAAMRYPESRLSYLAEYMFSLYSIATVTDNYLNTRKEPVFLPATLPFLLLNGASGIAVGTSTDIPPHNLKEVCKALKLVLTSDKLTLSKVMRVLKAPDWSYGGVIYDRDEVKNMYDKGKGTVSWGPDVVLEKERSVYKATIVGIPPNLNLPKFLEKLKNKKGIQSIQKLDISDKVKVVITTRSDKVAEDLVSAKVKVHYEWNVLGAKGFCNVNLLSYLEMWVEYLVALHKKFFIKEAKDIISSLKMLALKLKVIDNTDRVIEFIKREQLDKLQKLLDTDKEGLALVTAMSIGSLSKTSKDKLKKLVVKDKKEYKQLISNYKNLTEFLVTFLEGAATNSPPRKTRLKWEGGEHE
jgi:DNA gyrase/topoisomerase IV subunit A